jgi:hypothetical protein
MVLRSENVLPVKTLWDYRVKKEKEASKIEGFLFDFAV